jgi:hypothetical protein
MRAVSTSASSAQKLVFRISRSLSTPKLIPPLGETTMKLKFLTLAMIAAVSSACTQPSWHVINISKAPSVQFENKNVAVMVVNKDGARDKESQLEPHLVAALVRAGHNAKSFPQELAWSYLQLEGLTTDKYSVGAAMQGGGQVEGSAAAVDDLLNRTEKQDEITRYQTLKEFSNLLYTQWSVDYVLLVERYARYTLHARLIDPKTHNTVASAFFDMNREGFSATIAGNALQNNISIQKGPNSPTGNPSDPSVENAAFAETIVKTLRK